MSLQNLYCTLCLFFITVFVNGSEVLHLLYDNLPFNLQNSQQNSFNKFILIPSFGYEMKDAAGQYTFILNGWYFQVLKPGLMQSFITLSIDAASTLLNSNNTFNKSEVQERLKAFFVSDVAKQKISLELSGSILRTVFTNQNGTFREVIVVKSLDGLDMKEKVLNYRASDDVNPRIIYQGTVHVMRNRNSFGCSIISDIDDTIKISQVPSKTKLMINTFLKEFQAVPGMSDVYRSWETSYQCLFHYVSAMPSQLYYITQKFLDRQAFPRGSFHMRHLKLSDQEKYNVMNSVIEFVSHTSSKYHKVSTLEVLISNAPLKHQFVMVGDSGESDPEIYGQIARQYPNRIKMIFIRVVEGGKNDVLRFSDAFKDVPNTKWKLFTDANELPKQLYESYSSTTNNSTYHSVPAGHSNHGNTLSITLLHITLHLLTYF